MRWFASEVDLDVHFHARWNLRREPMTSFAKTTVLSLSLLAGVAFAAHAQSSSVASLPPGTVAAPPAATAPVAPSTAYPGPNPGTPGYSGMGQTQATVAPSPPLVGASPGASNAPTSPHFEKSADWESNTALHPYTSPGIGPRAH
jgi:hypothetical protein